MTHHGTTAASFSSARPGRYAVDRLLFEVGVIHLLPFRERIPHESFTLPLAHGNLVYGSAEIIHTVDPWVVTVAR